MKNPTDTFPLGKPASNKDHWLTFDYDPESDARGVAGCHCGFRSDWDSDAGYGDSVVDHLIEVGILWGRYSDD